MKVIKKHGTKPVSLFEVVCPECGCLFECDETDFELKIDAFQIDTFPTIQMVSCPDCEVLIEKEADSPCFKYLGKLEKTGQTSLRNKNLPIHSLNKTDSSIS